MLSIHSHAFTPLLAALLHSDDVGPFQWGPVAKELAKLEQREKERVVREGQREKKRVAMAAKRAAAKKAAEEVARARQNMIREAARAEAEMEDWQPSSPTPSSPTPSSPTPSEMLWDAELSPRMGRLNIA